LVSTIFYQNFGLVDSDAWTQKTREEKRIHGLLEKTEINLLFAVNVARLPHH